MSIIKIAFVGDICPGGVLHSSCQSCISNEVREHLRKFDLRIGNLESAIGEGFAFDEDKIKKGSNIIYSKNDDIRRIKEIGIDVVSIANNHVTDLGLDGLLNTINILDQNNILHFGAGRNKQEADAPAVIEIKGKEIAIMGFYDTTVAPHPASEHFWGVSTSDNLIERIEKARESYDYVFVLPHWGFEHIYRPLPGDKKLAIRIIEAGADGVIGSHPHRIQPYIIYKKKPIFFSLGNFLFPDFYQQPPCPIWYPDSSSDITNIPHVHEYVSNHKEYVKFIWRKESRIGLIAEFYIEDEKITVNYNLTSLDEQNRIVFLSKKTKYIFLLSALSFFIQLPFYHSVFFLSECYWFLRRKLSIRFK